MPNFAADKLAAAVWARELLEDDNFVVLDTETTSLRDASVVQIAIINSQGETLLDSLVRPDRDIEEGAKAIHGISEEMVKDAPELRKLHGRIMAVCQNKTLIIYNAAYDYPILQRQLYPWEHNNVKCAMKKYAAFCGQWSSYHQSYTFQKLPATEGVIPHSALGDALSTLALIKTMAEWTPD